MRTYTVRHVDAERREISIDFVVHGEHGVAGPWAASVEPGQPAYLMGPSGAYAPDPAADWHLLAGDEAGLPAISAALEALPPDAVGQAFIEVSGPDDEIALIAPDGVEVRWIYRGGRADLVPEEQAGDHAPLIAAVKEAQWLPGSGAGLHPRRGAGRHAQPAVLHPQGARRRREVGVDLRVLAARSHRGDLPAVEGRTGESGGRHRRLTRGWHA